MTLLYSSEEWAEEAAQNVHVSGCLVRPIVEVAQSRGISPEVLLGSARPSSFSELVDRRTTLEEYQALLRRAVQLCNEPGLGLACGFQASEPAFGLMTPLVAHTQTLRHAISLIMRFRALVCESLSIELTEHTGSAHLSCCPHPAVGQEMVELMVAGLVRLLRGFGCTDSELHAVCFEYKRPLHHRAYTAAFQGKERFAQAYTGVEFSSRALDRRQIRWQPELSALMLTQAEQVIDRLSSPLTYTERVRAFLRNRREQEPVSMCAAAKQLGVSGRTLRRRLELEGTSYRELAQSALYESACAMLRDPNETIQTVAHTLGYSSSSSFHRAFSRWNASTPLSYRGDSGAKPLPPRPP